MGNALAVIRKEWTNFLRSDRSVFVVYAILVLAWSGVLFSNMRQLALDANTLWWVFFSVIVSGNFSNTAFVGERLSGSLEVVLCCGISRRAIIAGKIAYVIAMSAGLGLLCYGFALVWTGLGGEDVRLLVRAMDLTALVALYLSACFMNASCGAWLSVYLANPRLSHFANLLLLGFVVTAHALLSAFTDLSPWVLPATLLTVGAAFFFLALRAFDGERVVQPYTY